MQGDFVLEKYCGFLECRVTLPITILCDNMGAVFLSNNYEGKRTKYLDTQYHFVREYVDNKTVMVKFVRSEDNYADLFTKNVRSDLHRKFTEYMFFAASVAEAWWGIRMDEGLLGSLPHLELTETDDY